MRNDTDPDLPSDRYGFHRDALRDSERDAARNDPEAAPRKDDPSHPRPRLRVVENEPLSAPSAPSAPDEEEDLLNGRGLARLRELDDQFDEERFIGGAERAYEMILQAFAQGDRQILQDLLTPPVLDGFAAAIDAREKAKETLSTEILRMARPIIDDVVITQGLVQITVRFVADIRTRLNEEEEGEAAKTEDLWTFDRRLDSQEPNWLLSATQTVT